MSLLSEYSTLLLLLLKSQVNCLKPVRQIVLYLVFTCPTGKSQQNYLADVRQPSPTFSLALTFFINSIFSSFGERNRKGCVRWDVLTITNGTHLRSPICATRKERVWQGFTLHVYYDFPHNLFTAICEPCESSAECLVDGYVRMHIWKEYTNFGHWIVNTFESSGSTSVCKYIIINAVYRLPT